MVVFDFCKTIVRCNSTFFFMKYYASIKKGFALKFYTLCVITKVLRFFCLIDDNMLTKIRIFSFRNELYDEVLSSAQAFAIFLENKEVAVVVKRLEYLEKNKKVLVSSNSLDFILSEYFFYKNFKADIISSSLEVKKERFTGFYDRYLLDEGKVCSLLSSYPNATVNEFWTDDLLADKDLVDYSIHVNHVNGDRFEVFK